MGRNQKPLHFIMQNDKPQLSGKNKLFVLLWVLLCSVLFVPTVDVVSISSRKQPAQKVYSREAVFNGFVISYTHSVNKGRVHDFYEIKKDGSLNLYQTEFVSYGAGIPEPEETDGAVFTVTDTGYVISNLNRNMKELVMAVGVIADHSIKINTEDAEEVMLNTLFAPQTSLLIGNKKISLLDYIKYLINKSLHKGGPFQNG